MAELPNTEAEYIEGKKLMDELVVGDQIIWGERKQPLTVCRHVAEDDLEGQVITMKQATEAQGAEHFARVCQEDHGVNFKPGDCIEGSLTGEEFLLVRGPRGGAYILTQQWSKRGGTWSAKVSLHRCTRNTGMQEPWQWENHITVKRTGHTDEMPDFAEGGGSSWLTIDELDLDEMALWADAFEGTLSQYNQADR